ncbi:HD domain-containing protein [Streptomyces sp. NPDC058287]|uniref:HD domain-containing protein n=1 Tax=unclassified Streptomyces TaxID=2593676 RepID=UPI0036E96DFC
MDKAQFTSIDRSTRRDWEIIAQYDEGHLAELPDRLLEVLARMGEGDRDQPYQVTRLEHCLQTATRALLDGAEEEMVVAALLHDIGDELALFDHAEFAASILKPYVSRKTHWIIQQHDVFQGKYYWDHLDLDPDTREKFRDHPWFDACEAFCLNWDCPSFDPDYESLPLEHFVPMVRGIFARKPFAASK